MRHLVLILLILFSVTVFGQSRKERKLKKLYKKEKYDKCIKKSKKYAKKRKLRKEAFPAYYGSKASFAKFKEEQKLRKRDKYLRKSLRYAYTVKGKDIDSTYISSDLYFWYTLRDSTENFAGRYFDTKKTKNKSKFYFDLLAKIYNDTTPQYWAFHGKELMPKVIEKLPANKGVSAKRKKLVAYAKKYEGTPYKYGGMTPTGFDCSGFCLYVFKNADIELPHNAHMQSKLGKKVPIEKAKPGDMIFFGSSNGKSYRTQHAGIVYSNENGDLHIIHCVSRGVQIDDKESNNWKYYWGDKVLFVKRIIED